MQLKRLELWWRRLWIRVLVLLMRRAPGPRPSWSAQRARTLFLRHDRAGDMILSTGVMRAIARSHPTIALDVLASPANAAILEHVDYVNRVVVFNKRSWRSYLHTIRALRRANYDAVIDCMVTAPSLTTLLLIYASGARYRIGIAGRGNDDAFNVTVPSAEQSGAHMVDLLAPLAAAFDVDARTVDREPSLHLAPDERARADAAWGPRGDGRRVLINVSAGTSERLWREENYVAVARHIRVLDPNAVFRVIAAPSERARGERVARESAGAFVTTPSIRDAFALVATADFVFTPDTSIAHAASAFQTSCVAMYFRGKTERWGLRGPIGESVEHTEPTLATLSVDRMIEAVDRVWLKLPLSD